MSLSDNYALTRARIEQNQLNYWRCYQSMQYLSEIDDLRTFVAGYSESYSLSTEYGYPNELLTAEEYGLLQSVEAHIGRLVDLRADLLAADPDELKRLYQN